MAHDKFQLLHETSLQHEPNMMENQMKIPINSLEFRSVEIPSYSVHTVFVPILEAIGLYIKVYPKTRFLLTNFSSL